MVRVGERMKRARRRMAVAERVARIERRRRVPSIVVAVVFAVLAVSEVGLGMWCCSPQWEREEVRWREEGYWVRAKSYLVVYGEDSCLSCPRALGGRAGC